MASITTLSYCDPCAVCIVCAIAGLMWDACDTKCAREKAAMRYPYIRRNINGVSAARLLGVYSPVAGMHNQGDFTVRILENEPF